MKRTNTQQPQPVTPGFAILLTEETDLGHAILIAEDDAGGYQPIGIATTLSEAREIAATDLRGRMQELERGGTPFCPALYKVWAQGLEGCTVAAEFDSSQL